jgi:hypothetical protein
VSKIPNEIRSIELTTAWSPNTDQTYASARVTVRRNGQRRLSHESFIGDTHADALRALALAVERGYPNRALDEIAP